MFMTILVSLEFSTLTWLLLSVDLFSRYPAQCGEVITLWKLFSFFTPEKLPLPSIDFFYFIISVLSLELLMDECLTPYCSIVCILLFFAQWKLDTIYISSDRALIKYIITHLLVTYEVGFKMMLKMKSRWASHLSNNNNKIKP